MNGVKRIARTKFNVGKDKSKRTYNGICFDSQLEMKYYRDIICPEVESGRIVSCDLQVPYELQRKFVHNGKNVQPIKYVADFFVRYSDGSEVVIDTKGLADSTALLKRKLFWFCYPDVDYRWICWSPADGGWCGYDDVKKKRAERKRSKTGKGVS